MDCQGGLDPIFFFDEGGTLEVDVTCLPLDTSRPTSMDVLRRPDLRLTFLNLSRLAGRRSADAGGFIFFLGRPPRFWTRVDYSRKKSTRISEVQIYGGIDPPSTFFGGEEGRDKKGEKWTTAIQKSVVLVFMCVHCGRLLEACHQKKMKMADHH